MEFACSENQVIYQDYYSNSTTPNLSVKVFLQLIDKPLSEIEFEDIVRYFKSRTARSGANKGKPLSNNRIRGDYHAIRPFLLTQKTRLKVDELENRKSEILSINGKEDKKGKAKVLTPGEIDKIRSILFHNKDKHPQSYFTFELAYNYDLTYQELCRCGAKNYVENTHSFQRVFENDPQKMLTLSEALGDFVSQYPKVLTGAKSVNSSKIPQIAELSGISFKHQDLMETKKRHFFTCSFCNKRYPPDPNYWIVATLAEEYTSKWMMCQTCFEENSIGGE